MSAPGLPAQGLLSVMTAAAPGATVVHSDSHTFGVRADRLTPWKRAGGSRVP